jgi:isocitrate lyase
MTDFYNLVPGAPQGRFDGIERPILGRRRQAAARLCPDPPYACRNGRQPAVAAAARGRFRQCARRHDRQPGHADGPRRAEGDLSLRLAGRGRQPTPHRHVSRPVALSGQCRPGAVPSASTAPCSAPTRSSTSEGKGAKRDWFAPIVADAEAGFGGPLNAFEIMKAYIEAGAPASTSRTSWPRKRSAAISAARC